MCWVGLGIALLFDESRSDLDDDGSISIVIKTKNLHVLLVTPDRRVNLFVEI